MLVIVAVVLELVDALKVTEFVGVDDCDLVSEIVIEYDPDKEGLLPKELDGDGEGVSDVVTLSVADFVIVTVPLLDAETDVESVSVPDEVGVGLVVNVEDVVVVYDCDTDTLTVDVEELELLAESVLVALPDTVTDTVVE